MRYIYFGHHKCASQYIVGILRDMGRLLHLPACFRAVTDTLPFDYHTHPNFKALMQKRREEALKIGNGIIGFENADAKLHNHVAQNGPYRGFHVIRDPRDILVSGYFSHLYSHPEYKIVPWWSEQRQRLLQTESIEAGLLCEMEFSSTYIDHIANWNYDDPNVFETRYETLTVHPFATFRQILNFWGIPTPLMGVWEGGAFITARLLQRYGKQVPVHHFTTLPLPVLWYVLRHHRFAKKANGRKRGEENQQHHYRKGVAGDWRNYFTPLVTDLFKERYGALLIQLGYERDLDWSRDIG